MSKSSTQTPSLGKGPGEQALPQGKAWLWLTLAALAIGLLRFFKLGAWGLWVDEAFTLSDARALDSWQLADGPKGNLLGLASVRWMVSLLTEWPADGAWPTEWHLRFLPACAGFLVLPVTIWAFAPFVGRTRAAAAALLVAVSPWHLYWSQTARFYTLSQLCALVAGAFLLRSFWSGRSKLLAVAAVFALMALLSHLSGTLLPAALFLGAWGVPLIGWPQAPKIVRPRRLLTFLALVLVPLLGVLWIGSLWSDYQAAKGSASAPLSAVLHFALTTGSHLTPALGVGLLLALYANFRRPQAFDSLVIAACIVALLGVTLAATQARATAQYVFCLLPWLAVLATRPLANSESWSGEGNQVLPWAYLALLVLPLLARQALYFGPYQGERCRWREAYTFVAEERGPNDMIIGMCPPVGEYYLRPGKPNLRKPESIVRLDPWNDQAPYLWARRQRDFWLVINFEWLQDWPAEKAANLQRFLAEGCHLVRRYPLDVETRDLGVWVYRFEG